MNAARNSYDVVVVGGGHNALVSAAYLARAGLSVVVLERLHHTGGAAVSVEPFAGQPARLSRYSYLVSLMPEQLMADLDLDVRLASRTTASYTPWTRGERSGGLLVERPEGEATRASFLDLTGSDEEYAAWEAFYGEVGRLAEAVAPTLMRPLPLERDVRALVDERIWTDVVEEPLGRAITRRFADDTVRGVVATDALIGTFASMDDPSLVQNRCFLYHLIGNGTGEWRVPIGGMGAVTDALARAAVDAGAEIVTGAGVGSITPGPDGAEVVWHDGERQHSVTGRRVLSGVAPWVLRILLGEGEDPDTKPAGSQLKINFLLDRLPALRSGVDPAVAFAGTLHLAEDYSTIEQAYAAAAGGSVPDPMPGEVYCHSLSDPSILGDRAGSAHTLTYFGLHTPAGLFDADPRRQGRRGATCARLARRGAGRAARRLPRHRRRRAAVHRGQDPAGRREGPGDAGWPHLPRRPRLAVGPQPVAARDPCPAVGCADRGRLRAPVRLGSATRWGGLRPRRPQRGAGRARRALSGATSISPADHDAVEFYSLHRLRH